MNQKLINPLQEKFSDELRKKACHAIEKIALPLFESFDLTFFSYKLSQDDDFIFLTSNYSWLQNCMEKNYLNYLAAYQPQQDFFLWDAIEKDSLVMDVYKDAKEHFNIDHGCTIIKCIGNMEEHFNFATTRRHTEMNNFYIENMEILERFIVYFKHKAKKIIDIALGEAINLKDIGLIRSSLKYEEFYREIDRFIEKTQVKTIPIIVDQQKIIDLNLTLAHTGYYLIQELSYKQIAREMYVSEKTIEARIAKLRKITNTNNKKELLHFLNKTDIKKSLDLALMNSSRHKSIKRGWVQRHILLRPPQKPVS